MPELPFSGLKVVDVATLFAGPLIGTLFGDFGAEVLKVEHPRGDPARSHGPAKDGVPLWWKVLGRNKRAVTLYLGAPEGRELFLRLTADADVVIENFRPGTLERWDLGYDRLSEHNPGLVLVRVTGFGQFGPYAARPGFGTLAEAMSGFAHITGEADGPPTLPPFGLADGITALTGFGAALTALYHRDARGGHGQVVDLAIVEPILTVLGAQPTIYDQLGIVQQRNGNRSSNNAPRNTYRTRDGRWVAVSTSTHSVAERVLRLVGHPEVVGEPWFQTGAGRAQHGDQLDGYVAAWIGEHDRDTVVAAFADADAAVAPIYDVADVMSDPQYEALESITTVSDPELGQVKMQNVLFRLLETPGRIAWAGRPLGADNEVVYRAHGYGPAELAELRERGVI
jgi:crotonobetainyl-CoA:carnitine CoA-transferase CaiB-like acyl-CoA transferase